MPTYLISGANRGLGLEVVKQLAAFPDAYILAGARNPQEATELQSVAVTSGGRIKPIQLEVTDEESIKGAVKEVEVWEHTKGGLDVLLNNAGILAGGWGNIHQITIADLQDNFRVNLYGTINLTLALLPCLTRPSASSRSEASPPVKQIYTYSSVIGSMAIAQKTNLASAAAYAVSKAALDMWTVKLGLQLKADGKEVVVRALHPGWATTGMSGPGVGDVSPEDAVKGIIQVIRSAKRGDPTVLISYKNEVLPW